MLTAVLPWVLGTIVVAMAMSLYRVFVGPSYPDRVVGIDTVFVNTAALLLVLDIFLQTDVYFEAVLIIAMMGFVGTCALAKYLLRGDVME
jgi:multicomponent K+:H+ antiporter subunit F